jgi:glutathione S-transferase
MEPPVSDEIIFHHYFTSPFSEKVRLMFGLKGLAWRSVLQPNIMPKPDLTPLTGGYRRIPVMQIGADVFCDSAVIMAEIERRHPSPKFIHGADWATNQWADRIFFQPVVAIIFGAIGHTVPPEFIKDREAMSGGAFDVAGMKASALPMKGQFRAYAARLEQQLSNGKPFVAGDAPGLDDIAWYMNVWFYRSALRADLDAQIEDMPNVSAWRARIRAIGYGEQSEMSTAEAIAVAASSEPASSAHIAHDPKDPSSPEVGAHVHVVADDYTRDPIAGTLVASNLERIVIAREDPRVGRVNVHFPRVGFMAVKA